MKQSILKRTLLTACLGASMAGVAMAGPVGWGIAGLMLTASVGAGVFANKKTDEKSSALLVLEKKLSCNHYQGWANHSTI